MKTYDNSHDDKSGKIKRKGKNANLKKIQRHIASLNPEQISRMMEDSGKPYVPAGQKDVTGQAIYRNALQQRPLSIQAKLEISQPGDTSELQADKVADAVSRGDVNMSRMTMEQTGSEINMKGEGGTLTTTPEFDQQLAGTKGSGSKMEPGVQREMETHMGADLSGVNIHTGATAAGMNEGINSKAFTHGQDIYFNQDQYNPGTPEGRRLLAHELTHTQQQGPGVERKIQRAMKFEFQTGNYVWKVDAKGNPSLLPRKYGPEGKTQEKGNEPAFLATGKHGLQKGQEYYEEVEGKRGMVPVNVGWYDVRPPQFIKEYTFKDQIEMHFERWALRPAVVGKKTSDFEMKKTGETDNSASSHIPDTFRYKFYNKDGTTLPLHIDENGNFGYGEIPYMKVGHAKDPNIDESKYAEYIELIKIVPDDKGPYRILNRNVKTVLMYTADMKTFMNGLFAKKHNPGTYERRFFTEEQCNGNFPKDISAFLPIHLTRDGFFQGGHVKFMKKKKYDEDKEQTAMELQSEEHGVLEFETPKWFSIWSELKIRIQDAVDMTEAIKNATDITAGAATNSEYAKLLTAMETAKGSPLGRVVEWPESEFPTTNLKKLHTDKGRLVVEIMDETWEARIQFSEQVPLSKYGDLLKEYGDIDIPVDLTIDSADKIIDLALAEVKTALPSKLKFKDEGKDETLDPSKLNKDELTELAGFLQVIANYIIHGQHDDMKTWISKDLTGIMSRTSFYSMYHKLLGKKERLLFQYMVEQNIITRAMETPLNDQLRINGQNGPTVAANFSTGNTLLIRTGHKAGKGPLIKPWLQSIITGIKDSKEKDGIKETDLLSPPAGGSAAMGSHEVHGKAGHKDTDLAWFELRNPNVVRDQPASNWVNFARERFDSAMKRSADTPDNPKTSKDESSPTGLKYWDLD